MKLTNGIWYHLIFVARCINISTMSAPVQAPVQAPVKSTQKYTQEEKAAAIDRYCEIFLRRVVAKEPMEGLSTRTLQELIDAKCDKRLLKLIFADGINLMHVAATRAVETFLMPEIIRTSVDDPSRDPFVIGYIHCVHVGFDPTLTTCAYKRLRGKPDLLSELPAKK